MDKKTFIIADLIEIKQKEAFVLGVGLVDKSMDTKDIVKLKGSDVLVSNGTDSNQITIIDIQITFSLAGFRNVFLRISCADFSKVAVGDFIYVS